MARNKGTFNFSSNFEILNKAPLDARCVVNLFSELTTQSTWQDASGNVWLYKGILVSVVNDPTDSNNGLYRLKDEINYTNQSNWVKIDGGSSSVSGSTSDRIISVGGQTAVINNTELSVSNNGVFVGTLTASNLSGSNTGDETKTTIQNKIGAASASNNGYLTTTDWTTFNDKQDNLGFTPENSANRNITQILSNSTTGYPSEYTVKSYVDSVVQSAVILQGDWDAETNTPNITGTTQTGYAWRVSVSGSTNLGGFNSWDVGDVPIKTATGWLKIDNKAFSSIWGNIAGNINDQTDLVSALNTKVNKTTKINGYTLTGDVTINKSDIGLGNVSDLDFTNPINIVQDPTHRFITDSQISGITHINRSVLDSLSDSDGVLYYNNSPITTGNTYNAPVTSVNTLTGSVVLTTNNISDYTDKRYINDAQKVVLSNTSGTNTGDETTITIKNKLGAASQTSDGYLKSSDWLTFYNKQNNLNYTPEDSANKEIVALDTSTLKYPSNAIVKNYVDSRITGSMVIQGDWNAATNTPDISVFTTTGYTWIVSTSGTTNLGGITSWNTKDLAVRTATGWIKINNTSFSTLWGSIGGTISSQTDLQDALSLKIDKSTKINGYTLTGTVNLTKTDIGLSNVKNVDTTDPSNITTTSNYRFVTDTEKTNITHLNRLTLDKFSEDATNNLLFNGSLVGGGGSIDDSATTDLTKTWSANKLYSTIGSSSLLTTDKTLNGAINEVFRSGVNAKSGVVDAINARYGSQVVTTGNTWNDLDFAITTIPLTGSSLATTGNFTINAGGVKDVTLAFGLPISGLTTSVLEYNTVTGSTINSTVITSGISSNFIYDPLYVSFNTDLRLINNYTSSMTSGGTLNSLSLFNSTNVDRTKFNTIESFVFNSTETSSPQMTMVGAPTSKVVKMNTDIDLTNYQHISSFSLSGTVTNPNNVSVVFSFDGGLTWKSYKNSSWIDVDITNTSTFLSDGMSIATVNSLIQSNFTTVRGSSNTIRVAFLLYQQISTESAVVAGFTIKGNQYPYYSIANNKYTYTYTQATKLLSFTFNTGGTYLINYRNF